MGCVAAEEEADELLGAATGPEHLSSMLARRVEGEPLAWIVGFCSLLRRSRCSSISGVYVPRWPERVRWFGEALQLLGDGGRAVDLCTGSGAGRLQR